jgi:hypothetical protein
MASSIAPVSTRTRAPPAQRRAGEPERFRGRSLLTPRVWGHRAAPSRLAEDGLLDPLSSEGLVGLSRPPVRGSSSPRWSGDHRSTLVMDVEP